ncbi:aminoglycoside phosphotransferase family protein [Egicoccus sp. AB-alg2]|uniref:aminoglycoside phosphotransferase family protein n=1 Tax=Egicoccus sp. AB-alg2 TaxID=3242693 RepID=UPI00359DEFED
MTVGAFGDDLAVVRELGSRADGRDWLQALPALVADLARDWRLRIGAPWPEGRTAWTAPAVTSDGREVVLKVVWPHPEAAGEAAALTHWSGHGAVRLLRHDPSRWALLLSRCRPGVSLRDHDAPADVRLRTAATVLRRLWDVAPPTPPLPVHLVPELATVAASWAALAESRLAATDGRHDPGLARHGIALLRSLPSVETSVMLHGDFNPGNVLSDAAAGWQAIDAKPMLGDPAYDPWPLLTQLDAPFAAPDPAARLAERYRRFGALVGVAPQRLAAWSVARTIEMALWQDHHGRHAEAAAAFGQASVLARVDERLPG